MTQSACQCNGENLTGCQKPGHLHHAPTCRCGQTQGDQGNNLPPLSRLALNIIEKEGQITERALIVRMRPAYPELTRSIVRILREDGLIGENAVIA